jgi:sugar-phosphatase
VSLLSSLEGARWAVVTSCGAELARVRMQTAGLTSPPLLISGSDVAHGKPEPEPYLLAASRIGVTPAECIVIEDAPAGIQAGKRAGMRVVAIAFTYPPQQLRSSAADVLVDRLTALSLRPTTNGKLTISFAGDPVCPA